MAYIDVSKIETVRFMCHKILPLVYDESLSYYEVLCKVANKLNENIEATNQLEDNVTYLNDRVTDLTTRVNLVVTEVNTFEADVTNRFNTLEQDIVSTVDRKMGEVDGKLAEMDNKINQLDNTVEALSQYIEQSIRDMTAHVETLINESVKELNDKFDKAKDEDRIYIYNQLKTAIKELPNITSIMVTNPTTHTISTIQEAIDDIFVNTRYYALTCDEYNSLKLTVNKLITLKAKSIPRGFTIIEWLTYAKKWLHINPEHDMFMPTGEKANYRKSIEYNTDLLRVAGCLTMAELDEVIDMTYEQFADNEYTANDLAWYSHRLFA